ncbi:hypothetical protein HYH02_004359 [Chlamydomonas schloesseri]|uniref:ERD4-related membrane protein n=1 Tax=Chlamydomonas schloesseri TaxID=2026947 RepID=A0A835WP97_9CHLO|nr:hypothetical protein HYH02_004359 [Chlamydomonas schloesseri]|eukprot:KAG2451091.1 hypothetical protein HYH02_004359 [Chlamydomonas schloesseri]
MAADSAAVLTSFLLNFYICLGCFALFTVMRVRPWAKRFFGPRRYSRDVDIKPKRLSNVLLGWIKPVMMYKEEDIIDEAGLDAAMYLRVVWFGMELFFVLTLVCIPLVLPPNMTGNEIERLLAEEQSYRNTTVASNTTIFANSVVVSYPVQPDDTNMETNTFTNARITFNGSRTDVLPNETYNYVVAGNGTANFTGTNVNTGALTYYFLRATVLNVRSAWLLASGNRGIPNGTVFNQTGDEVMIVSLLSPNTETSYTVNGVEFKFTNFDKYSLSNVSPGSEVMWCHMIAVYVVALFVLWRLRTYNLQSVYLRLLFLGNAKRGGPSHTVLVTDVPYVNEAVGKALRAEEYRKRFHMPPLPPAAAGSATPAVAASRKQLLAGSPAPPKGALKGAVAAAAMADDGGGDDSSGVSSNEVTLKDAAAAAASPAKAAPKSGPGSVAGGGGGNGNGGGGDSAEGGRLAYRLKMLGADLEEDMLYRLEDPSIDPEFASTGGKLEAPRVGRTAEQLLTDLQREEPEPTWLPPGYGVDTRVLKPDRRDLKRFRYDVTKMKVRSETKEATKKVVRAAEAVGTVAEAAIEKVEEGIVKPAGKKKKKPAAGGEEEGRKRGRRRRTYEVAGVVVEEEDDEQDELDEHSSEADAAAAANDANDGAAGGGKGVPATTPPASAPAAAPPPPKLASAKQLQPQPQPQPAAGKASQGAAAAVAAGDEDADGDDHDEGAADVGKRAGPVGAAAMDPIVQAKAKLQAGLTPQQLVAREFALVYQPYNIAAVNMIQDTSKLEPLVEEYNQVMQDLQDYLDMAKLRLKLRKALPVAQVRIWPKLQGEGVWPRVRLEMTKVVRAQFAFEAEECVRRWHAMEEAVRAEEDPKEKARLEVRQVQLVKEREALPEREAAAVAAVEGIPDKKLSAKVDAVTYWLARLKYLRERIRTEQAVAAHKPAPSAFVTFNTRMAQGVASNSLHAHDETVWRITGAPAPNEVVWRNLPMTHPVRSGRLYILWVVFWAMALFFIIPISAIQALIEVPKLASVPVLGDIVTAPVISQFIQAIIPGLVLKIFLAVVPHILWAMALLSGSTAVSEIDFGVVSRYFLFQVIVVFFGCIIAGSFFNQIKQWIEDPGSVITVLGKSIPMTATFFITYLFVNGLGAKSIGFVRLPGFIIFWILSKFAGSPRARERMWMNQSARYGVLVPDHTIAILLGLVFSCMNPIVCPAALAYFLVAAIGERYNFIYVYRQPYESGGHMWKTVYNQVMVGLYLMLLTMFALLAIKRFKWVFFMLPICVIAVLSHLATLSLYSRPWSVTALHDAAEMDMLEADQRREQLLAAAREERKKGKEAQRRRYEQASIEAERLDLPQPDKAKFFVPLSAGPAELLLKESLRGDGFALNSAEKKEIADMYRNPGFTMHLEEIEDVEKLARVVQLLLPPLNHFVAEYKTYRRNVKAAKIKGSTEEVPAPHMPEDLTIFDNDPRLLGLDRELAEGGGAEDETSSLGERDSGGGLRDGELESAGPLSASLPQSRPAKAGPSR